MAYHDSFKIIKNTKEFIYDVVLFSRNFPKGEAVLKRALQEELFSLMRLLHFYVVNHDSKRIKGKYMKDFIVSLSMIDFYFEYLYQNKIISFKKYQGYVESIIVIRKLAYGVLKNEKEFVTV